MFYSVVLVLLSLTYVTPNAIFVNIDPEQLPALFNTFMICVDKTGVDSKIIDQISVWNFEDNDSVKKYIYCFAEDSGFGDKNGHLVKEKIVQLIGNHQLRREFLNAIDECNKLQGGQTKRSVGTKVFNRSTSTSTKKSTEYNMDKPTISDLTNLKFSL